MPSIDYTGLFTQNFNKYGTDIKDPYTGQIRHVGGSSGPISTGPYDPGSPLGSAYQAEPFNLGQSGNLTQLSDLINNINRNAQTQNLQARIPNAPALEQKSSDIIGSELKGQVPQDVVNLLGQQAAERGVGTGVGADSANTNAAYLRALGRTSLEQQQLGEQNLTAAYGRNPAAPLFDTSSQLISPLDLAKIQEQGLGLNEKVFSDILNANLKQQQLNLQAQRYANPNLGYGYTGGTGTNPITGSDVIPGDTFTGNTGGGGTFGYSSSIQDPYGSSTWFDTAPSQSTGDYGNPVYGGGDYAQTPASMYG